MKTPIPTNAVLNDMNDADMTALAAEYGVTADDRAGRIKALKAARNEAAGGGAQGDTGAALEGADTGSQAGTGAGPSDQDKSGVTRDESQDSAEFVFDLGAKVFLFERNFDPETSEPREGYQAPKPGKIVKITEDTDVIDVETGGEDSPKIVSHDVAHQTHAQKAGANYWAETAE